MTAPTRRAMERAMSEKALMQAILDCARLLGWKCIHHYDSRRTEPGWPDIVCVRGDRILAMECKTERGKATKAQLDWLLALNEAGVVSLIVRPDDWLEGRVEEVLT
jgi:hypothetical protein